ncbi:bifunctional helix-turn-helix transcriptional regulator/GNAT family N-acetyltransferase [Hirschia baltica]|uniref:Transcriptional regulator, MarR family with acetyltransferase activity n=1 Tax=Hirschia baltica (strain ATCC 49814 / DSM 5838 / IFAM 1418) TaxID=582402 RepID=C6XQS7_HIRBI|nr:GNAT family N-acetyltransferase [Hirschia baltica]ACT58683.1 transcriptional regulator, MarR family with acetyltransferase activity [Hirschia baltica ATCC 49814]
MVKDILENAGYLALGSRLKRLAERLQADAARLHEAHGFSIQPSQFPLLKAIDTLGSITVAQAVEALGVSQPAVTRTLNTIIESGLVTTRADDKDQRVKWIELTPKGEATLESLRENLWPHVQEAAKQASSFPTGASPMNLLDALSRLEQNLNESSLEERVLKISNPNPVEIVDFTDDLAQDFHDISEQWVSSMFKLEQNDREIIENPRKLIIDRGGVILFAKTPQFGVVGTCALIKIEDGIFELTKMGVTDNARGLKIGEKLLQATINRAKEMNLTCMYLLTNKKCEAAIHLYEKNGFIHDPYIMEHFGARYERCNVAMSYPL